MRHFLMPVVLALLVAALGCDEVARPDKGAARLPGRPETLGNLSTVRVVAERAEVAVEGWRPIRVERGRVFGVIARNDRAVKIQVCDGEMVHRGWIDQRHVKFLTDEDIDLASEALQAGARLRPTIDVATYRSSLNALAARVARAASAETSPRARTRAICRQLFGVEGFASGPAGHDTLDQVLDTKRGRCFGLSILFLCVVESQQMPFYLVSAPRHVFVRYDDGRERFNIEMTSGGAIHDGEDFLDRHLGRGLSGQAGGIDHLTLPESRILGLLQMHSATKLAGSRDPGGAAASCARALELNPLDATPLWMWGGILMERGDSLGAVVVLNRSLRINPHSASAHLQLGKALFRLRRYRESCKHCAEAARIDPTSAVPYHVWGCALARMGQLDKACTKFAVAVDVDPKLAMAHLAWGATLAMQGRRSPAKARLDEAVRLDASLRAHARRVAGFMDGDREAIGELLSQ